MYISVSLKYRLSGEGAELIIVFSKHFVILQILGNIQYILLNSIEYN
ncbi:hypothetical protein Calab_2952 [Caldithrix abyssi DSM 13497]|uniref:Uncharacterized protein n=1 Tax=Caldithrix abyssi DSM 13497 TaxID=880073 RepID=H1XSL1_CALAY|nr:hypothetical protein Calab_2952 [Caldithrix abyssi DSM 13497]